MFHVNKFFQPFCFILLISSFSFQALADDDSPVFNVSAEWGGKYMNEGRSEFEKNKDGVFTIDANMEWLGLNLGATQMRGDKTTFNESQLYLVYGHELFDNLEASLIYNYVWFPGVDEYDNETGFAFFFKGIPFICLSAEYIYSEKADGAFVSLAVVGSIGFLEDRLTLEPYLMENFDFGFGTEKHDGANNLQTGVEASMAVNDQIRLTASVNYSLAQEDIKREAGEDGYDKSTTWGSVGVAASF